MSKFLKPADRNYKEVRRTIVKNQKKKASEINSVVEEFYVDSYRSVAVQLGANLDLKSQMTKTGAIKTSVAQAPPGPGEPNDAMYLKQAEHLMKRSIFPPALMYLNQALIMNPTSKTALSTRAKCLLMMGHWEGALESANEVLETDCTYVRALLVKAEALYNTCSFEHALKLFHRGQILAPDMEEFRLGVQKCRKTIQSTVVEFNVDGAEELLESMRQDCERLSCLTNVEQVTKKDPARRIQSDSKANHGRVEEAKKIVLKAPPAQSKVRLVTSSSDRLSEDKDYLSRLAVGMGCGRAKRNKTEANVSRTAVEALAFLKARDEFWKQVDLGTNKLEAISVNSSRLSFT